MPLFQMTVKAVKVFYIEADSESDALGDELAQFEFSNTGDLEFEVEEMSARELDAAGAELARRHEPELVFADQNATD